MRGLCQVLQSVGARSGGETPYPVCGVELSQLLAWLMFPKHSHWSNCLSCLVLELSAVRKLCWPSGAGWAVDAGSSLDSQQLEAR